MEAFDPSQLLAALERILPSAASGRLCVAFSGGLDSSVLLQALAQAPQVHRRHELRAIYIDHQLQAQSHAWREHCAQVCRTLGIGYHWLPVTVRTEVGVSIEAEARHARYAALASALAPQETLLTAHHADDQLETVLLALLRGSGIKGLAAMPALQVLGPGWHARPLLEFTRATLHQWAHATGLAWVSDPSNDGLRFDRSYLRNQVIARLQERWPAAALSVSRAAAHAAEAEGLLEQLAQADAAGVMVDSCLQVSKLALLSGPRRRNLLRHWLRNCGASTPSTRKLAGLEHDMLGAARDRVPCTEWDRFAVRKHRDLLYCTARELIPPGQRQRWDWSTTLSLGALGELSLVPAVRGGLAAARLPPQVSVAFRPAAESLLSTAGGQQRKLKRLLQKADVLPWWRDRVPVLVNEGVLLAVGDWWVSEKFAAVAGEPGVRVCWKDGPAIRAVSLRAAA
jgi:tRNA(Ile)-lysidine synthase